MTWRVRKDRRWYEVTYAWQETKMTERMKGITPCQHHHVPLSPHVYRLFIPLDAAVLAWYKPYQLHSHHWKVTAVELWDVLNKTWVYFCHIMSHVDYRYHQCLNEYLSQLESDMSMFLLYKCWTRILWGVQWVYDVARVVPKMHKELCCEQEIRRFLQ